MLFNLFKRESAIAVMEEPAAEKPKAKVLPVPVATLDAYEELDAEDSEWLALATEIGIRYGSQVELELFLEKEWIPQYNTQQVFDYLDAKAKTQGKKWRIWPLRDADIIPSDGCSRIWAAVSEWSEQIDTTRMYIPTKKSKWQRLAAPFMDEVPLAALATAKKLIGKFGPRVRLMVLSDSEADPFLAVTLDDCHLIIVERWDEYEFRGSK